MPKSSSKTCTCCTTQHTLKNKRSLCRPCNTARCAPDRKPAIVNCQLSAKIHITNPKRKCNHCKSSKHSSNFCQRRHRLRTTPPATALDTSFYRPAHSHAERTLARRVIQSGNGKSHTTSELLVPVPPPPPIPGTTAATEFTVEINRELNRPPSPLLPKKVVCKRKQRVIVTRGTSDKTSGNTAGAPSLNFSHATFNNSTVQQTLTGQSSVSRVNGQVYLHTDKAGRFL